MRSMAALPGGAEDYVHDSIESSLGLPVSDRSLRLKLLASKDRRRLLQDHIFSLEEDLRAAARRIDLLKAKSTMNAAGLRRCVQEKEAMATAYNDLSAHSAKLERECSLYERDLERAMESCDDLDRENDQLRARLNDNADDISLLHGLGIKFVLVPGTHVQIDKLLSERVAGDMKRALDTFDLMRRSGCAPTVVTYNALIHGLIRKQQVERAVSVLDKMSIAGIAPNEHTYTIIMRGYAANGDIGKAFQYFTKIKESGLKLDVYI